MTRISTDAIGHWSRESSSYAGAIFARLSSSFRRLGASLQAGLVQRRLRHDLAELDPSLLRDIGVADDEIARIQAREPFTPRTWQG